MKKLVMVGLVVLVVIGLTGKGFAAGKHGTAAEAEGMVKKAIAMAKAKGNEAAFAEINNPKGQFTDRDLYVFVYDINGKCVAHGQNLKMVGKELIDMKDADGKVYDGANKYVIHFSKGQLPPVRGFWSITMYDANYFFVANSINRYSISARQNLKANPDGSIDLYIQNQSPGTDKESNWLPAPKDKFVLMLRMYWPNEKSPSIINRTWTPPAVKKERS